MPGSHGGFNRIDELNDRIAAFIKAQATGNQAAQPAHHRQLNSRAGIRIDPLHEVTAPTGDAAPGSPPA